MDKKFTALFLIFAVAAAELTHNVSPVVVVPQLPAEAPSAEPKAEIEHKQAKWDDLGTTANINKYVDDTIKLLVPFIQNNGLDPMELPEIVEGFSVKPLLITYSAWLKIQDGYMTGLVNIDRDSDQTLSYFAKMLRLRLQLQFSGLEIVYKYLVKVMNIGPSGGLRATLERFVVNVDLLVDFNNDEVHLQHFSLTDVGRLRVRLTGNILTDWLVNPVIRTFTSIFNNVIINVIQANIRSTIQDVIDVVNINLAAAFKYLDSFSK